MYSPEEIRKHFDNATLKYLHNKNRGGNSGQKGNRYEDYFAVYKLAQLARDILQAGSSIRFSSQLLAFVDDLIIKHDSNLENYQLKNSSSVSWNQGNHPIQVDFLNQHKLNQLSYPNSISQMTLVISDKSCAENLTNTLPALIQSFSQVLHFPYDADILTVVNQVPAFKDAIVWLSAFDQPEPDKIEYVVKALIGVWVTSNVKDIAGEELLHMAQKQSPQLIRSFETDYQLDPEVEKILSDIENLTYNLAKGFLHWNYADGLSSGTPPYSIDTEAFDRLQERIKTHNPTTFEELEPLL